MVRLLVLIHAWLWPATTSRGIIEVLMWINSISRLLLRSIYIDLNGSVAEEDITDSGALSAAGDCICVDCARNDNMHLWHTRTQQLILTCHKPAVTAPRKKSVVQRELASIKDAHRSICVHADYSASERISALFKRPNFALRRHAS